MFSPTIIYLLFFMLIETQCGERQPAACDLKWTNLPSLPDSTGFAGSFAGVANGVLLVAGGSNFPGGGAPWKGSTKKWYDKIFVLETAGSSWKEVGRLPVPLGYGVSISTKDGLVIIGGSNEKGHVADVWRLQYKGGQIHIDSLPPLPFPLANTCGALMDNKIYVAGGLVAPDSPATSNTFLVFDNGWKTLPTWPGPSRMLAIAGAASGGFYLFSGAQLVNGAREYLTDAYVYTPDSGWKTLTSLPNAVVAAPSPAYFSKNDWLVFGGDDGALASQAAALKEKHPGFSDDILKYNVDEDRWQVAGKIGAGRPPVTTPMVEWNGQLIFPGGEIRPATRTPNVLSAIPCE